MNSIKVSLVGRTLDKLANQDQARASKLFFKTGQGDYAEKDRFIGVSVPIQRKVAKQFQEIKLRELEKLINSPIHEYRMTGLLILVEKYYAKLTGDYLRQECVDFYLGHVDQVNNWDLVDTSCYKLLGDYLWRKQEFELLYRYAGLESTRQNLWKNRIAIVTTLAFIRHDRLDQTYQISEILIRHPEDLIQKAVGWMLREAGKRDRDSLIDFLNIYAGQMPRTMLGYAIERFEPDLKRYYRGLVAYSN